MTTENKTGREELNEFLKTHGREPVDHRTLSAVTDAVVEAIRDQRRRVDAFEARLVALETRPPTPKYQGVFAEGKSYARGSLCTRKGGLWLALTDTTDAPGTAATQWKLVVKSGEAISRE